MKTTNEYLTKIRQFKQQCAEKYGIISIGIFGSVARGEQHEGSDLDVFVELKEPDPFVMFDIKEELQYGSADGPPLRPAPGLLKGSPPASPSSVSPHAALPG